MNQTVVKNPEERQVTALIPRRWPTIAVAAGILWLLWYPFAFTAQATGGWLAERDTHKINAVANVSLFLPLGLAIALWLRPRSRFVAAALVALVLGAALSLVGETGQTHLRGRISSAIDVINNTIGAFTGVAVGWFIAPGVLRRWVVASQWIETRRLTRRAFWMLMLLIGSRTAPWDVSPETAELKQRLLVTIDFAQTQVAWLRRAAQGGSILADAPWWAVADALLFGVVTFAVGRAYRENLERLGDRTGGAWMVVTVMLIIAAATELMQVPLQSRTADPLDLVGCAAGVVVGTALDAAIGRLRRRRSRQVFQT